jgi:hypothetical protein
MGKVVTGIAAMASCTVLVVTGHLDATLYVGAILTPIIAGTTAGVVASRTSSPS